MKIKNILLLLFCAWLLLLVSGCGERPVSAFSQQTAPLHQEAPAQPAPTAAASSETELLLTDPQQVSAWLLSIKLARSEKLASMNGWWHIVEKQTLQKGDLHGMPQEWWVNYNRGETCPEGMQITFTEETSSPVAINFLLLRDGPLAKSLKQVPYEQEAGKKVIEINEQSCGERALGGFEGLEQALVLLSNANRLHSVEARSESGQWTVEIASGDGVEQIQTLVFDPATGETVKESFRLYKLIDHTLLGETESVFSYEFFAVLPAEIEAQFAGAVGSLTDQ